MTPYVREFHGPTDWGWINSHVPLLRVEDTCGIVMIDLEKNETVAAMILDNIMYNSVQAHLIIQNPLAIRHGFLTECADLVFNHMDKEYIYGMVAENREKALKLNKHMGFTEKTILPGAHAEGVGYVLMELHRDNCSFLPKLEEAA